jgi:hypothetical protein
LLSTAGFPVSFLNACVEFPPLITPQEGLILPEIDPILFGAGNREESACQFRYGRQVLPDDLQNSVALRIRQLSLLGGCDSGAGSEALSSEMPRCWHNLVSMLSMRVSCSMTAGSAVPAGENGVSMYRDGGKLPFWSWRGSPSPLKALCHFSGSATHPQPFLQKDFVLLGDAREATSINFFCCG